MRFIPLNFLILFLSLNLAVADESDKEYPSLLWEVSGNGLTEPSYLFGTMHVSNKVAFHLSDSLFLALESVDIAALETDPSKMLEEFLRSGYYEGIFNPYGTMGHSSISIYEDAFNFSKAGKKAVSEILTQEGDFINHLLYRRLDDYSDNFRENTYLDLFIYQAAKKSGKDVAGLENFDEMIELTTMAMMPDEDSDSRNSYEATPKNLYEKIESAYRKGDLDLLDSLTRKSVKSNNYRKYLIDERNFNMLEKFDSLMAHKTVFAGVGAAHLPGPNGLINLLRLKGYQVRPILKKVTNKGRKKKSAIEETYYNLDFNTACPADSSFRVGLPGRLLEIPKSGPYRQYVFPEMINGGYFTIFRRPNYMGIFGDTPDILMGRLDSLLYENIPGKILEKKEITKQGYPGYDIKNRLLRGDVQRHQIFVTPLEIFIFKMSGSGEFVNTKNGDIFFDSIQFRDTLPSTLEFRKELFEKAGFSISLPGLRCGDFDAALQEFYDKNEISAIDSAGDFYYLFRALYNDFEYIEEDTFELNIIAENLAENIEYDLKKGNLSAVSNYPALDAEFSSGDLSFNARFIKKGSAYYMLATTANGSKKDKYFNSLEFLPELASAELEEYTDTVFFYKTLSPKRKKYKGLVSKIYSIYNQKNNKDNDFNSDYYTEYFREPQTGETIELSVSKFHKYEQYDNIDSLWNSIKENLSEFEIRKEKNYALPGIYYLEIELTDTATVEMQYIRFIQRGRMLYSLDYPADTSSGLSAYAAKFFESFSLLDTTIGKSLFECKADLFFEDIFNEDSSIVENAFDNMYYVDFEDRHAEKIIELINEYPFDESNISYKISLINELGNLKNEEIRPYLKGLYHRVSDTSEFQIAVLKSLSRQKTINATEDLLELILYDTPLTDYSYEVNYIFTPYRDTLQLARALFPGLMELAQYPEYKQAVYVILASLIDSGLVKKEDLAAFSNNLINYARTELKRKLSNERMNSDESFDINDDITDSDFDGQKSKLITMARIIYPLRGGPRVESFYEKLLATRDKDLKIASVIFFLKKGIDFDKEIISQLAEDYKTRNKLYYLLKKNEWLDLFPEEFGRQKDIAKAALYSYGIDWEKDSVTFIDKIYIKNKDNSGYAYFYKRKSEKDKKWYLDYTAYHPENEDGAQPYPDIVIKNMKIKNGSQESVEEAMKEALKKLRLEGRRRARKNRSDYIDYY